MEIPGGRRGEVAIEGVSRSHRCYDCLLVGNHYSDNNQTERRL